MRILVQESQETKMISILFEVIQYDYIHLNNNTME